MKNNRRHIIGRNILLVFMTIVSLFAFNSCARKINFQSLGVAPTAHGTVKVKRDHNHNYRIRIHITNLMKPEDLHPPRLVYVVWMTTQNEQTKNIGKIKTRSRIFSKKLRASFETVTPFKPVRIFITAEDGTQVRNPGMQVVMTTDRF